MDLQSAKERDDMNDTLDSVTSQVPISLADLGRSLREARTAAGFARMTDLASAIELMTGVSISARSLYAMERGEQMPSFLQMVCILAALPTEQQRAFCLQASHENVRARLWCTRPEH